MNPAFVCALALFAIHPQTPGNHDSTTQGSQANQGTTGAQSIPGTHETVPQRPRPRPMGMTLENLHGLPMIRPTWPPPQPQPEILVYAPNYYMGPGYGYGYSYGLGGYNPPRALGYNPQPLFLFGFR